MCAQCHPWYGHWATNHPINVVLQLLLLNLWADMCVTFGRLAVIDFDGCHCLLIYCVVRFRTLVHFRWLDGVGSRNVGGNSVRCIFSCIDSGIFWTGIFEMPEVYITVDHVVDRSPERAVCLWRYV